VPGPAAVLAGSCAPATLAQVAHHRERHPTLALTGADVMAGRVTPDTVLAFLARHRDGLPLVASSAPPEAVRAQQAAYGREALAARLDALFAEVARRLVADGLARLVVAGGETSGAVVSALALDALAIGPEIDPGVPALAASARPLALALKSGNFGAPDFFAKAAAVLGGAR
jgi:3-dehydrotetronate 4-kinase